MSYSLYDTIRSSRYENCVILTYSINLNVYESIIWRRLHTNGCYNNVLFVDGDEYDHALSQDKRTLEYLGQGYVICPIYSVSAFHPKIILLTSKTSGKLIISSANITMAAFTQHSELINEFNYDESHEDYLYLFNDCWNYLMAISQDVPLYVREQIEQLFETTPWIQKTGNRVSDYTFIAFPKHQKELPPRIYDLLLSIFGTSSIEELTVLSPFFDSDLRLLKQIREKFNIGITNFIIDPFLSLDPLSRPILSKETNIYRFSNPLDSTKYKSLHAKAIYFKTDKGRYLLCGSMNFTTNAMGIPLKENNYEAGILYKLGSANYYEMLSLADIVQNNNRVKVDDLKFEKRESAETKDRNSILITWAESSYGNINLQLKFAVPSSIKELIMSFFNNAGNPTGNIRIKDHINGSNQISSFIEDRSIIDLSTYIELHVTDIDGKECISNKAVLNKIERLREATAKSDFVKKIRKLSRAISDGQNYEVMLDLLRYFLFDSYEQSLPKGKIRITTTPTDKEKNNAIQIGKLTMTDIISTEPPKSHIGSYYMDHSTDIIKDIFINSFLKARKSETQLIVDKIAIDYDEEKKSFVTDDEEQDIREEEDETEEEPKHETGQEEGIDTKRDKDAEGRLLKNLVRKYFNHINVLKEDSKNIRPNIENEFLRNYIAFLMITRGIGEGYRLFSKKNKNIKDDLAIYNLSLGTELLNRDFTGSIIEYVVSKQYEHERGFSMGLCSILTGIYLTDLYLQKKIEYRFQIYELRENDILWISNRLLLLSLLSKFRKEDLDNIMGRVEEDFIRLKNYSDKILKNITFHNISEIIENAMKVWLSILDAYKDNALEIPVGKLERGHHVVSKDGHLYIIKYIDGSRIVMHGGISLERKPYELVFAIGSDRIKSLGATDALKSYYGGLLTFKNSCWYSH